MTNGSHLRRFFRRCVRGLCRVLHKVIVHHVDLFVVLVAHRTPHDIH